MSWQMQKINDGGVSVGPDAAGFIPNDMFVCVFTDQHHFTYLDGNGNLQDVWYDGPNNRWNLQQINNANGNGPVSIRKSCERVRVCAGRRDPTHR